MGDQEVDLDLDDVVDVDFDDDWAEEDARAKPRRIKVFGEIVEIPRVMPALLVLFAYKARTGGDDTKRDMKPDEIVRMVGVLVGQDRARSYIDRGIGFERLVDMLVRIQKLYKQQRDSEGEAQAPAATETATGGSGSSSSTGASSSPTGIANTTEQTSSPTSVPV